MRLAADEAVKALEPLPGGPPVERRRAAGLVRGHSPALPEQRGRIAVVLRRFRQRCTVVGNDAGITRGARCGFRNRGEADVVVIAAGEQRRAGRRNTARSCESGCTSSRSAPAVRAWACGTDRRTSTTPRTPRRRAARPAHWARRGAVAAAGSGETSPPDLWLPAGARQGRAGRGSVHSALNGVGSVGRCRFGPLRHDALRSFRVPRAAPMLRELRMQIGGVRPSAECDASAYWRDW